MQQTYIITVDGAWERDGKKRLYWIQGERIVRVFFFIPWEKATESLDLAPYHNVVVVGARLRDAQANEWKPIPVSNLTKEIVETTDTELILVASEEDCVGMKILFMRPADPREEAELLTSAVPTLAPPEPEIKSAPIPLRRVSAPPTTTGTPPSISPRKAGPQMEGVIRGALPTAPAPSFGGRPNEEVHEEVQILKQGRGQLRPSPLPHIARRNTAASYAPSGIPLVDPRTVRDLEEKTLPAPPPFSSKMPSSQIPLPADISGEKGPKRRS